MESGDGRSSHIFSRSDRPLKTEEKALPVMDIAPEIGIEMESLYPHLLLSSCPLAQDPKNDDRTRWDEKKCQRIEGA